MPCIVSLISLPITAHGATLIDYSSPGVAYGVNGAVIYTLAPPYSSAGTGNFGGYLTVLGNTPVISGISTDSNSVMPDVSNSQTEAIPYGVIADQGNAISVNGSGTYISFGLDLNEPLNSDSYVSVDTVRIYHSAIANPSATSLDNFLNGNGANAPTLVWDMDAGADGDVSLLVNAGLTSGSGQANMGFAVPSSFFSGYNTGYFFIYYSEGAVGSLNGRDYGNAGGFEEFGLISGQGNINTSQLFNATPERINVVPEPGTVMVLGGLSMLSLLRRRRPDA